MSSTLFPFPTPRNPSFSHQTNTEEAREMKRQDSLPTSSSHRENATEKLQAKAVGCMSGFFHFVSTYHTRRKFLTFGKRQQQKNEVLGTSANSAAKTKSSPYSSTRTNNPFPSREKGDHEGRNVVFQRFSCEVPRSPTLPAEIRRSNSVNSPQNFRSAAVAQPTLLVRLMGLEEAPATALAGESKESRSPETNIPAQCSAAEKRKHLLGALEKCDRDLKALKKIIDAVRSAERLGPPPASVFRSFEDDCDDQGSVGKRFRGVCHAEQPSPVSVLDEFTMTRSPLRNHHSKRQSYSYGKMQHQLIRQQKKKPGEEDFISPSIFDRLTCESLHRKPVISTDIAHNIERPHSISPSPPCSSPSRLSSNKAMEESVEEVCSDIAWGEKREMGRIGLALQDHIFGDLIEETVIALGSFYSYRNVNSLPFEACKRKLCF